MLGLQPHDISNIFGGISTNKISTPGNVFLYKHKSRWVHLTNNGMIMQGLDITVKNILVVLLKNLNGSVPIRLIY